MPKAIKDTKEEAVNEKENSKNNNSFCGIVCCNVNCYIRI